MPITQQEYERLPLKDRRLRNAQIWADTPSFIHRLLKDKLQATDDYSATVDRGSKAVVLNALKRGPLDIAAVYLRNVAD